MPHSAISDGRWPPSVTSGKTCRPALGIVAQWCDDRDVDVSAADIDRIPAGNVRVPRAEFGVLWQTAERSHDEQVRRGVLDWYGAGVVETCRWLANAIVGPKTRPWRLAPSPVTERVTVAYPELIEAECVAAENLATRRPVPTRRKYRPGWIEAVVTTLNWAWRRHGSPPLVKGRSTVG